MRTILQHEPLFGVEEADAVREYVLSGGWCTEHTKTREFEQRIAAFTGAKHCVATNNGTVSLMLAGLALGIGPGDEVLVPNYTMIASANAFAALGARPVFVDVDPETLCMDWERAIEAVDKHTKAVVLVTANGRHPEGIERWRDALDTLGVALIEDAAQSLGSYAGGLHCGRHGIVGSFSFSAPKVISTGQGGALITDDDALAAKLRALKDFGRAGGGTDVHPTMGWNYKWTDLQAVVGLAQLDKLHARLDRKLELYALYASRLGEQSYMHAHSDTERGEAAVRLFARQPGNVPWYYDVRCQRRDELAAYLRERGIGTRPMYPPLNAQDCYRQPGSYPVSQRVGREGLWLPSSAHLTDEDVHRVCDEIEAFYRPGRT